MLSNLKIILAAYGTPGILALETLFSMGLQPAQISIFSHQKDERNLPLWSFAAAHVIEIVEYAARSEELLEWVRLRKPTAIFSLHYRDRIPVNIIALAECGGVNLHPSLLPDYRGCFSIPWAIINGESETGFTYHYMVEAFDEGNIILQERLGISKNDTAFSLFHKLIVLGLRHFERVFQKVVFEQDAGQPQPKGGRYYPRAVPYEGLIDPTWSLEQIERFIRAMCFPPHTGVVVHAQGGDCQVASVEDYLYLRKMGKVL